MKATITIVCEQPDLDTVLPQVLRDAATRLEHQGAGSFTLRDPQGLPVGTVTVRSTWRGTVAAWLLS